MTMTPVEANIKNTPSFFVQAANPTAKPANIINMGRFS